MQYRHIARASAVVLAANALSAEAATALTPVPSVIEQGLNAVNRPYKNQRAAILSGRSAVLLADSGTMVFKRGHDGAIKPAKLGNGGAEIVDALYKKAGPREYACFKLDDQAVCAAIGRYSSASQHVKVMLEDGSQEPFALSKLATKSATVRYVTGGLAFGTDPHNQEWLHQNITVNNDGRVVSTGGHDQQVVPLFRGLDD